MLELKNVKKTYKVGEIETRALNGISVAFRDREFVAILGASGSGKTTCLNIIGGLDRYDSGEMTIKGKQTASFKDGEWDAYRNNSIGFVFQSYNLISHLSIVANVELGMTLSGVSKSEKRKRAVDVLTEVGLKDHLHKRPNQLSGGQMQRVAIARALANNPEILLCDEPTGALDSATSRQIMDLIRELSKERLVIMVTHNAEMAEGYADRTIKFEDGVVVSDSNPHIERPKPDMFNLKKTAMNFLTALNLSGNNILTKKGRTFLTAFASSIGIIGIAVILSLSNGFQLQIDKFQEDAMAEFPIIISREITDFNHDDIHSIREQRKNKESHTPTEVSIFDPSQFYTQHINNFTDEYIRYVEDINPDIASFVGYQRMLGINVLRKDDDVISNITFPTLITMMMGGGMELGGDSMMSMNMGLSSYPLTLSDDGESYIQRNYELLHGEYPVNPTDLVLVINNSGRLEKATLEQLGFNTDDRENIPFDEIVKTELMLIGNNDFYIEQEPVANVESNIEALLPGDFDISQLPDDFDISQLPDEFMAEGFRDDMVFDENQEGIIEDETQDGSEERDESATKEPRNIFIPGDQHPDADLKAMWDSGESLPLRIVGIVRPKEDSGISLLTSGIVYSDELCELVIERAQDTDILNAQAERDENVIPGTSFFARDLLYSMLGGDAAIGAITIYPTSFENKDLLLEYLDEWNEDKAEDDQIHYTDMAGMLLGFMSEIINAITIVLIAFAAISLVVSLIMIAIITYISVLERTKEIGILRALGARKKDITRVFDAETFLIGAFSGLIGVFIAWLLTFPANVIIENMTNLPNVAKLSIVHVILLLVISTALTVLGGHLPARMASKRDAVEALRSE
ncbi:MAG: ABC transporter ATP-binding protein/permease [Oscillospiraceae bacterium]|nr:ABC transporter ATP-binding protein/permease [Oscillospiraceae bacterium]